MGNWRFPLIKNRFQTSFDNNYFICRARILRRLWESTMYARVSLLRDERRSLGMAVLSAESFFDYVFRKKKTPVDIEYGLILF